MTSRASECLGAEASPTRPGPVSEPTGATGRIRPRSLRLAHRPERGRWGPVRLRSLVTMLIPAGAGRTRNTRPLVLPLPEALFPDETISTETPYLVSALNPWWSAEAFCNNWIRWRAAFK